MKAYPITDSGLADLERRLAEQAPADERVSKSEQEEDIRGGSEGARLYLLTLAAVCAAIFIGHNGPPIVQWLGRLFAGAA